MITIELFGCSGGMAEGFRRAGLTFTFAFDWDADACASYEANLHHRPVQMDARDLARLAAMGWSPGGPVDLLVADPPCTPWSRAGKRKGLDDERDMLVETCELIRHLRPTRFLISNVPGLDDGPAIAALRRTIGGLARLGYCVDYQRLDAANYGVPQHRHRPFWFGHLIGPCVQWPAPTHGDPRSTEAAHLPGMAPLLPWVTCREALAHLPLEELGRPVKLTPNRRHDPNDADAPGRTITAKIRGNGGQALQLTRGHPVNGLDEPSSVDTPGRTIGATPARAGSGDATTLSWPWDRPSTAVMGRAGRAPPGHHDEAFAVMSLPDAIVLSEKAAAILQGFPDGWTFHGATKKSRWSQIGMAMPPPLAHAVATSVRAAMESA